MKFRTVPCVVVALAFVFTACQQGTGTLSDEDVTDIQGLLDTYRQAALSGDWDTWAGIWAEDAVYMVPNSQAIQGRESIKAYAAGFTPQEMQVDFDEIDGRGDLAFARGTYSMTVVLEGQDEPLQGAGKFVWIVRKQPDGRWLVSLECYNSDLPLPPTEGEHSEGEDHR